MTRQTITPRQFVNRHGIHIRSEWTDHNPHIDQDSDRNMNHWKCTLTRYEDGKRRQMTVTFSMGLAHEGEPKADQVIECLAADAASIENANTFEEWVSEFYILDELLYSEAKRLERTYKASVRQTDSLRRFLGEDLYDVALWHMHDA